MYLFDSENKWGGEADFPLSSLTGGLILGLWDHSLS